MTPLEDVLVVLDHPFGRLEVSLTEWMEVGPGPRPYVRPVAAKHRVTGGPLPLSVVPLAYRNDEESRALIAAGALEDPWKSG